MLFTGKFNYYHWNRKTFLILVLVIINIFLSIKLLSCQNSCKEINRRNIQEYRQESQQLEPSLEYEKKRRRLRATIIHLWEYIKKQLNLMKNGTHCDNSSLDAMWSTISEHKVSLLNDWKVMTDNDGYNEWREIEAEKLSSIVQRRFDYLMNPKNCHAAKYFKCHGEWPCGWGCQLSQVAACFSVAYGIGRTLYFNKTRDKFYEPDENKYYEPISRTCPKISEGMVEADWPGDNSVDVIQSPSMLREYKPRIPYNIPTLPADLAARMDKVFEEPTAWWSGQINKYIYYPTNDSWSKINTTINRIGFERPIVGIHIRRGNKKSEAEFLPLANYMTVVSEFFDQLELTQKVEKRRMYLSTDDPAMPDQIKKLYPEYQVITNDIDLTKAINYGHYHADSFGVLTDVILLSLCDFFVGTFSSNLGRRMLEFRYIWEIDAMERVFSLDNRYYEYGEIRQRYRVIIPHKPKTKMEIPAEIGDTFEPDFDRQKVLDQHGFMPVVDKTKKKRGYLPSFKLEKVLDAYEFPTFGITH